MRTSASPVLVATGVFLALAPTSGVGQDLGVRFHPTDWGVGSAADLQYGMMSLALEEGETRLSVYELDRRWSPPQLPADDVRRFKPRPSAGSLLISRFLSGNRNALEGSFSAFSSTPGGGRATLATAEDGNRALRVECLSVDVGFCGAWVHLFDSRRIPEEREFLDARLFSALTFLVWTDRADDEWVLKIADAVWEAREDAPSAGMLHEFVESGQLGPRWQRVTLPLDRLHWSVDRSALASVILQSVTAGPTRILLRDLILVADPRASFSGLPEGNLISEAERSLEREVAVWVWNTNELIRDRAEARASIDFLRKQGVGVAFLQIPDGLEQRRGPGERSIETDQLRPLISALSAAGIRTYALDGAPWFAKPDHHDGVVQTVRNVVAYNAAVSPEERFYGVRYDVEPYLLPGFHGPRRDQILEDLLTLTERITEVAHEADLVVGLDIPFWYDAPNERSFSKVEVEWNGALRPASHHLIDLVDDVSVMAYRTMAYGADGTITHSEDELRFAASHGKTVFLGLETGPLPDEVLLEFWGAPHEGPPPTVQEVDLLVFIPNGDSVEVIHHPARSSPQNLERMMPDETDPTSVLWWPISRQVPVPASKLTFAELGLERLADVRAKTLFELSQYPSFAGFAIHDLLGWHRLMVRGSRP